MPYGMRLYDKDGNITLDFNDRTPRLISINAVTVPSSGTVTVNVSNTVTPLTGSVVTDNDAIVQVTAAGEVTIYGTPTTVGNTNLYVMELP